MTPIINESAAVVSVTTTVNQSEAVVIEVPVGK